MSSPASPSPSALSSRSSSSSLSNSSSLIGVTCTALLGLTSFMLLKQILRQRRAARRNAEKRAALASSALPPSTIDDKTAKQLAEIELGSDALRALFFLDTRSSTSGSSEDCSVLSPLSSGAGSTFCNHGSYGAVPRSIMLYFQRMLERVESNPDLWFRAHSYAMTREALRPFAEMMNTAAENLVFTNNATTAVNAVLNSLELTKGDVILTPDCTYNACKIAMRHRAQVTGATYIEFELPLPVANDRAVLDAFAAQVDSAERSGSKVKFVLVDAITSPSAIVMPWRALCSMMRERGIRCMVDGAHAIGQIPIDLSPLPVSAGSSAASSSSSATALDEVDYFTANLHKWLWAPKGCAVLYCRPGLQSSLRPLVTSHSHSEGFNRAFWMQGTREDSAYISAAQGVRFREALGVERCAAYVHALAQRAEDLLNARLWGSAAAAANQARALCPREMRCPNMRLVRLPWIVPAEESARGPRADRAGMDLITRYSLVAPVIYEKHSAAYWVRFSITIYNDQRDYQRLAEALVHYAEQAENKDLRGE